jgi:hypothetical protein
VRDTRAVDLWPLLAVSGAVALAAGATWWIREAGRQDRDMLAGVAALHGWTLQDRDDSWATRFSGVPFGRGKHRRAELVLHGSFRGRPMVSFDYCYETGSDETRSTTTAAICALALPGPVPRLEIAPPTPLRFLGVDSDLPVVRTGHAELDRRLRVRTLHPELVPRVLQPAVVEQLPPRVFSQHLWFDDGYAVCWDPEGRQAARLLRDLETLALLVDNAAPEVWQTWRA